MYARNHVIYLIPLALGTTEMPIICLKIKSLVFSGIKVRRKEEILQTTHTHQSLRSPRPPGGSEKKTIQLEGWSRGWQILNSVIRISSQCPQGLTRWKGKFPGGQMEGSDRILGIQWQTSGFTNAKPSLLCQTYLYRYLLLQVQISSQCNILDSSFWCSLTM